MSLRVYNTMSGKKGRVSTSCSRQRSECMSVVSRFMITAISAMLALILFLTLFSVIYSFPDMKRLMCRNYTDVDDKIINRANERQISSQDLAEEFIQAFDEDMDSLGLIKPTHEPRATDYIQQIIEINQKLIDKGKAYASGGDVYYSVDKFPDYLKLSKRNMDEMLSGARVAPGEQKTESNGFCPLERGKGR